MRFLILIPVIGAGLAAGGCTRDTAAVSAMTRAADPTVAVPARAYSSVTAGTVQYTPVGPRGWEETNRRVAPKS